MEPDDDGTVKYAHILDYSTFTEDADQQQTLDMNSSDINEQEDIAYPQTIDLEQNSVQYIEAEEVIGEMNIDNNAEHTIIIHKGRQYLIPTVELNSGTNTILIEDGEGDLYNQENYVALQEAQTSETILYNDDERQIITLDDSNDQLYYSQVNDDEIDSDEIGKQYAILRDGKLHFTTGDNKTINEKLRALEKTLNSYGGEDEASRAAAAIKDNNDSAQQMQRGDDDDGDPDYILENQEMEEQAEREEEEEEENDALSGITGRNLLTGQTISLRGFLEKMRKRHQQVNQPQLDSPNIHIPDVKNSEYVSIRPVQSRVVVGRTQDGKKLVGKILKIQKKVPATQTFTGEFQLHATDSTTFSITIPEQAETTGEVMESQEGFQNTSGKANVKTKSRLRFTPHDAMSENLRRTLTGLMDLVSIRCHLRERRVVVRHIQRVSNGGKVVAGSKRLAYYRGRMREHNVDGGWQFVPDNAPGIGANGATERHTTISVRIGSNGQIVSPPVKKVASSDTDDIDDDLEDEEVPITLYITETQDEFGQKKTKVSIPQLGQCNTGNSSVDLVAATQHQGTASRSGSIGSGSHVCTSCGKRFQTQSSLRRHSTVHDPSLRPLQCMSCGARFSDESSLRKHMLLHTGLRPHSCSICGKSFVHQSDLNVHMRTHDPLKHYECEVCGKQFNRQTNMLRHAEIHRPQGAASSLGVSSRLATSALTSSGENDDGSSGRAPYVCEQCGCQYNFISSLTRHIVTVHIEPNINQ